MRAVVVGCGRVGSTVATTLAVGHGLDVAVLKEAGIERADAVVVATDGDNTNIVVAQVAQRMFEVPSVVVRILDPGRADFYASRGLDVVCPTKTAYETLIERVRAGYAEARH